MKKLSMNLMMTLLNVGLWAGTYSGGSGTSGAPYQIATTADLITLSQTSGDWGLYFIQTTDIAFNADETQVDWDGDGSATWDTADQYGLKPIGINPYFTGSYDGQNHTISNIFINRSSAYIGLFGLTDNGSQIKNLGVVDVNITGTTCVGGLAGYTYRCTISNCYSTGLVNGTSSSIGGLIGYNGSSVNVSNCYSTATVSGPIAVGGFVGQQGSGTSSNCYSRGAVTRNSGTNTNIGGFCGENNANIQYCYSTGSVTYSSGTNPTNKGFVGKLSNGTCTSTFFNKETSGQTSDTSATAQTTTEMQTQSTFSGWNFTSTWAINSSLNSGYPYLQWAVDVDHSLPVELTAFAAVAQNGGVVLTWRTESETENLGFIIERKIVGANHDSPSEWSQIASYATTDALAGHGSTSEAHEYNYTDAAVVPGMTYAYRIADVDYSGSATWHSAVEVTVPESGSAVPTEFGLQKAYPNPFNPRTTFSYHLPEPEFVNITVYDVNGRQVAVLLNDKMVAGTHQMYWEPRNLISGIYLVQIRAGSFASVQKCVLVK